MRSRSQACRGYDFGWDFVGWCQVKSGLGDGRDVRSLGAFVSFWTVPLS